MPQSTRIGKGFTYDIVDCDIREIRSIKGSTSSMSKSIAIKY